MSKLLVEYFDEAGSAVHGDAVKRVLQSVAAHNTAGIILVAIVIHGNLRSGRLGLLDGRLQIKGLVAYRRNFWSDEDYIDSARKNLRISLDIEGNRDALRVHQPHGLAVVGDVARSNVAIHRYVHGDDAIPAPTERVEDNDGGPPRAAVLDALRDVAQRLAQNLATLKDGGLCIAHLARVPDITTLTEIVVVHVFESLPPKVVKLHLGVRRKAEGIVDGGKFLGGGKRIGCLHRRRPSRGHGGDDVRPGGRNLTGNGCYPRSIDGGLKEFYRRSEAEMGRRKAAIKKPQIGDESFAGGKEIRAPSEIDRTGRQRLHGVQLCPDAYDMSIIQIMVKPKVSAPAVTIQRAPKQCGYSWGANLGLHHDLDDA